ncbi:MAG: hypothetical protein K5907_06285 [Treponema sp.]|nr:hypothetical protein [Treponema sp.]
MACFTVPATEAIITTIAGKIIKSKEKHQTIDASKTPFSTKIGWLNKMLWGGSALLAFEHVWHGEVVPFFPFLTAVENGEVSQMLHEMATAGVSMALLVTAVWGIMVGVSTLIEKHADKKSDSTLAGGLA